jgi:4-amino-4-deoxy-L-arabinose transferase-like glycosyltransferase
MTNWPLQVRSPTLQALAIIVAFTALRVIAAGFVGLGTDESYSLAVSHDLQLSYFDHPPLQYWITHVCEPLLGRGRAERAPFIALFAGSSWLMYVLTRRLFGARAGVWAVLALNLSAFFTLAAGSWILPDGPLDFFLLAAAATLAGGWFEGDERAALDVRSWLLTGLFIGMAALSKYQAALFCVGLALFVLTTPGRRSELARAGPFLAAVVTLALLAPVMVWNAQHHWASFAFQAGRGAPGQGFNPLGPLVALGGQAGLLLPWIFLPLAIASSFAARAGPADQRRWFCLMLAAPTIVIFTATPLLSAKALPHWSMSGWLMLFPLLGEGFARVPADRAWSKLWAACSAAFVIVVGGVFVANAATGFLDARLAPAFHGAEPTAETIDWTVVRTELARRGLLRAPPPFIAAVKWNDAGKLDLALGDLAPVVVMSHDAREYGFRRESSEFVGRDALIVGRTADLKERLPELQSYFRSITWLAPIVVGREGRPEIEIGVVAAHDLVRPYPWRADQSPPRR